MEMRPDHGLWKDGQGAPCGGVGAVLPPRPAPRPPPRRRCGRTRWGSSGESSRGGRGPWRGGRCDRNSLLELLHDEVVSDLQEGGEGPLTGAPRLEVNVAIAEPAEDVEDQDTVLHGPAKVAERARHALHLAAELADGEAGRPRSCSASAIWRANASDASRLRSQAIAASRTRTRPSAAAARAATRAELGPVVWRWEAVGGGGAGKRRRVLLATAGITSPAAMAAAAPAAMAAAPTAVARASTLAKAPVASAAVAMVAVATSVGEGAPCAPGERAPDAGAGGGRVGTAPCGRRPGPDGSPGAGRRAPAPCGRRPGAGAKSAAAAVICAQFWEVERGEKWEK